MFKNTIREQNAGVLFQNRASSALSRCQQQIVYTCLLCMHLNSFVVRKLVLEHSINNYNKSCPNDQDALQPRSSGLSTLALCMYICAYMGRPRGSQHLVFFLMLVVQNLETHSSMWALYIAC